MITTFTGQTPKTKIRFIPRQKSWDGHIIHSVWVKQTKLSSTMFEEAVYKPTFLQQLFWFMYL